MIRKVYLDENHNHIEFRLRKDNTLTIERIRPKTREVMHHIQLEGKQTKQLKQLLQEEIWE